jgi:hypothetical protein
MDRILEVGMLYRVVLHPAQEPFVAGLKNSMEILWNAQPKVVPLSMW